MVKFHTVRRKSRKGKMYFFSNDVFSFFLPNFHCAKLVSIFIRTRINNDSSPKRFSNFVFLGKKGDYCVAQLTPGPP